MSSTERLLTHSSAYNEQYGCQFTAAIPTNVFGEGELVKVGLTYGQPSRFDA